MPIINGSMAFSFAVKGLNAPTSSGFHQFRPWDRSSRIRQIVIDRNCACPSGACRYAGRLQVINRNPTACPAPPAIMNSPGERKGSGGFTRESSWPPAATQSAMYGSSPLSSKISILNAVPDEIAAVQNQIRHPVVPYPRNSDCAAYGVHDSDPPAVHVYE